MAKSLKQQIKESEEKTRRLKNKLPLTLGKTVMNDHKITITNAHGKPVTYTSTAKATKGQTLKRKRTIDSMDEFKSHFKVVPATEKGLHTAYLLKLGLDVMKMYGGNNDGDFQRIYNKIKANHNAQTGNDSTDDNNNDDNDSNGGSNSSQDNPDNSKESDKDSDDQNGSADVK